LRGGNEVDEVANDVLWQLTGVAKDCFTWNNKKSTKTLLKMFHVEQQSSSNPLKTNKKAAF